MPGKLKDVRVVEFKEDFIVDGKVRYAKGPHLMHKSLAEKLKTAKVSVTVKDAEPEYKKRVESIKAKAEPVKD